MPMAARLGDKHRCDRHGEGPILPACCPTVLIGDRPAAREGDVAECPCVDPIVRGEPTVLIGDRPAARLGDPTDGGVIVEGFPTVWIGAARGAGGLLAAAAEGAPFIEGDV